MLTDLKSVERPYNSENARSGCPTYFCVLVAYVFKIGFIIPDSILVRRSRLAYHVREHQFAGAAFRTSALQIEASFGLEFSLGEGTTATGAPEIGDPDYSVGPSFVRDTSGRGTGRFIVDNLGTFVTRDKLRTRRILE